MSEQKSSNASASEKAAGVGCMLFLAAGVCFVIGVIWAVVSISIVPLVLMIISLIALIAGFISMAVSSDQETPEEKERSKAAAEAAVNRDKYNSLKYTCPMCGSHKIKNIGTAKKLGGVVTVGLASQNIGKNYQCDDCNYKW